MVGRLAGPRAGREGGRVDLRAAADLDPEVFVGRFSLKRVGPLGLVGLVGAHLIGLGRLLVRVGGLFLGRSRVLRSRGGKGLGRRGLLLDLLEPRFEHGDPLAIGLHGSGDLLERAESFGRARQMESRGVCSLGEHEKVADFRSRRPRRSARGHKQDREQRGTGTSNARHTRHNGPLQCPARCMRQKTQRDRHNRPNRT